MNENKSGSLLKAVVTYLLIHCRTSLEWLNIASHLPEVTFSIRTGELVFCTRTRRTGEADGCSRLPGSPEAYCENVLTCFIQVIRDIDVFHIRWKDRYKWSGLQIADTNAAHTNRSVMFIIASIFVTTIFDGVVILENGVHSASWG
jgi:hypothetical protein